MEQPASKTSSSRKPLVFLGGTCNGSAWRDQLIPLLTCDYFNPVVDEWNEEAQARELDARAHADMVLYALTPRMEGCYSVAEVVDDSNKRPDSTIMVLLAAPDGGKEFTPHQLRALRQTGALVQRNGGAFFESLEEAAAFIEQRIASGNALRKKQGRES